MKRIFSQLKSNQLSTRTGEQQQRLPLVLLTIAGFDPSGGAGVIADIKTFTAFDCFAAAAITSLTYQNTVGVFGASHQTAEVVRAQILPLVEDFQIAGVKTGMLPTAEIIEEVARLLRETSLPAPVVDPVVRSTSGFDLIDDEALSSLVTHLFPLAAVVTPNIPEAERLTHLKITNVEDMERAAKRIRELGATAVLVKGGHLPGQPIDVLDDRGQVTHYEGQRIASTSTHGTGCTLAAAIAACLARGKTLHAAVDIAKRFVTDAIKDAPGLGHGSGPVQHNTNSDRFFVDS